MKASEAKAAETKNDVEETRTAEPEDVEDAAKATDAGTVEEEKTDKADTETETETETEEKKGKPDRAAISERLKEIAKNGKAEGKPKKIKALLQEYGVEKVPDLPDDKLEEFLEKVEAL